MIKKRLSSLSSKCNRHFYGTVKIRAIIVLNVNVFNTYETLVQKRHKYFTDSLIK